MIMFTFQNAALMVNYGISNTIVLEIHSLPLSQFHWNMLPRVYDIGCTDQIAVLVVNYGISNNCAGDTIVYH